ncbi:complex I NDUFA9 subunit family protein [Sphingomonas prati]|uniref:NADH dehydrogenase n=1 Tax=Sphingomonas prati TaxID=1843237 RepID=A0A7W9BUM0_9SPHN|nr:complex I NDUFA9 subunit family protein [Sphingomonas prati]MBB5729983.1 NADH dehydrogenase [Sphingomonas prati]GGE87995.1 3-beta-hydroxy-Delta(5)-steroid dehydrogenase [Sphingomonas prati]
MAGLVTIFGGGGFLGRYVVQELLKAGARVRVAGRDPKNAWFLKPLGGVGQTQFVAVDITRADSVARAVQASTAVINLVGLLAGKFDAVHVGGARNVAEAAHAAGAAAIVQVSAIGADPAAASTYARSKGEGEAAVRTAFPNATILRPSIIFGPEDMFVNKFAQMARLPILPVLRGPVLFQPAFVADVAKAVARAALDPLTYGGRTFELGGPDRISMEALNRWVAKQIGRTPAIVPIPDAVGAMMAKAGRFIPGAPITQDQWLLLQSDNVVAPDAEGFAAFGIDPVPLAVVAPGWLVQYRRQGRFATVDATGTGAV